MGVTDTYKLVIANDCHDAQWFYAVGLGIECFPSGLRPLVAKHNIWMDIGIEITYAFPVAGHRVHE